MEAKFSNLKLNRYFILSSKLSTKFKETDKLSVVKQNLHKRPFEIDFDVLENENKGEFLINVKINSFSLNKNKRTGGYDFSVSAKGLFYLENIEEIEEDKEFQYVIYSALPMIISICRSHISALTSNGFFGTYTLPAVDLQSLVNDWFENEDKTEER